MLISIVIRTLNEEAYLRELLVAVQQQEVNDLDIEIVIIDSGSTDNTIQIAKDHGCRITFITKELFTFGRSLNLGSEFAKGDMLVYLSGHCVPDGSGWLMNLVDPLLKGKAGYTYGRQVGRDTTKFSERQIFSKYFPESSKIPQNDFFCNNANAAINRNIWAEHRFDEDVTGLEDMELAKRYCESGGKIAYVAEASVFHIHNESWSQTRRRYEREAIALQKIMPEIQVSIVDLIRYVWASILSDAKVALSERRLISECISILKFRLAQYTGTYKGNHDHRALSKRRKENYFYPSKTLED